jgi:hypothetical protein
MSGEFPKVDRIDELVSELATKLGPALRKCSVDDSDPCASNDPYMRRAKRVFIEAVEMHEGQNSEVARRATCTEGNIRLQKDHPKRSPTLQVVFAMNAAAKRLIGRELLAAADEEEAIRRAG